MKLVVGVIVIGVSVLIGISSRYFLKKEDNIVEEIAEEVIEHHTNYDIDLSPATKEESDPKKKDK